MPAEFENYEGPIPLFPLPHVVLFPHTSLPLHIFEPRYRRMVEDTQLERNLIGMVKLESVPNFGCVGEPPIRRVGCVGVIRDLKRIEGGRYSLRLEGRCRFEILAETNLKPYRVARVRFLPDADESETGDSADATVHLLQNLLSTNARARGEESPNSGFVADAMPFSARVHALAVASRLTADEAQALLEMADARQRARELEQILRGRIDARSWAECWRAIFPSDTSVN